MTTTLAVAIDQAWRLVQNFCCDQKTAKYGPCASPVPGEAAKGRMLPDGRLSSFKLVEGDEFSLENVDVQMYPGLNGLGGILWDQEIRALPRISSLLSGSAAESSKASLTGGPPRPRS